MLKSHEKFHSANGRRLILVADDEMINREILGHLLSSEYEVLFASDGRETLEIMRANSDTLSLVLLDLLMPVLSGMDVLRASDFKKVVAATLKAASDRSAELGK